MDNVSIPIGLLALIVLITYIFFYMQARQKTKVYRQGKRKFSALSGNLLQLKEHIVSESDRWPIYARPAMFTAVDHNAQIEFAKAQKALTEANEVLPLIETSPEPETPEQFQLRYVFNIPMNLKTISTGDQFIVNIDYLEQKIASLRLSVKSLRTDRFKVESIRREVEEAIQDFKKRIDLTALRIKPLDTWKSIEDNGYVWIVDLASECYSGACEKVNGSFTEDQGYLGHATADIYVKTGNFSLDCVDLLIDSQIVSRHYELDDFHNSFNGAMVSLKMIIESGELDGWKKLPRTIAYVDKFPETKLLAARSLYIFMAQKNILENLIGLMSEWNLEIETEQIEKLEADCAYYWYSYEELKDNWEKALGSPPRLPSVEINRFRALLATDILPSVHVDMLIKQSQMMTLIRKISYAFSWREFINTLVLNLETELDIHLEAQKDVESLLSSQGKATVLLAKVKIALIDTSPDLADLGSKLVNDHLSYVNRKERVRGADFPDLKKEIESLTAESGMLIDQHVVQLAKLMTEYKSLYNEIGLLRNEMDVYINYTPKFDNDTVKLLSAAYKAGSIVLQEHVVEKYSWLRAATNTMRTWMQKVDPFISQARERHQAFEAGRRQVENWLNHTKDEISIQKLNVTQKWGWYTNEISPKLETAKGSLIVQMNEWKRLEERKWIEYSINRAIAKCEHLAKFSEEILQDLNEAIGKVNYKQNQLNGKTKDVKLLLQRNSYKLSQQEQREINSLIEIAAKAANYDSAEKMIDFARTMALKRATSQVRNEIKKIINIYSGGGPVFMESVRNTGSISGRADKRTTYRTKGK